MTQTFYHERNTAMNRYIQHNLQRIKATAAALMAATGPALLSAPAHAVTVCSTPHKTCVVPIGTETTPQALTKPLDLQWRESGLQIDGRSNQSASSEHQVRHMVEERLDLYQKIGSTTENCSFGFGAAATNTQYSPQTQIGTASIGVAHKCGFDIGNGDEIEVHLGVAAHASTTESAVEPAAHASIRIPLSFGR